MDPPGKVVLRLRLSQADAHYGGALVDGARMLALFGDVATELLVRLDGDEGLFRAYDAVEFLAPVHAGDYVEAEGEIVEVGNTSRRMRFVARKVIAPRPDLSDSAAEVLPEPLVVCRASGTCVTPREKQRLGGARAAPASAPAGQGDSPAPAGGAGPGRGRPIPGSGGTP